MPKSLPSLQQLISDIDAKGLMWFLRNTHHSEKLPGTYLASVFAWGDNPLMAVAATSEQALWSAFQIATGAIRGLNAEELRAALVDAETTNPSGPESGQSIN